MKKGGQIVYSGPLGQHSSKLIDYFQVKLADDDNYMTIDIFHPLANSMAKAWNVDLMQNEHHIYTKYIW